MENFKINRLIPYQFQQNGYDWTLISVYNDFSKKETLGYGEYENQYGHIKKMPIGAAKCLDVTNI